MLHLVHSFFPAAKNVRAISQEASTRSFFRLTLGSKQFVIMVYQEPSPLEISRILHFTPLYANAGVQVPVIYEIISDQALLQEDLGNRYFQYYFKRGKFYEKSLWAKQVINIAKKISTIPVSETSMKHDFERQQFEMDFFLTHFLNSKTSGDEKEALKHRLIKLIRETSKPVSFAHRDFHSRNILFSLTNHGLVDFQDSLRAHPYYDLASFLWDAYLHWTEPLRTQIITSLNFPPKINVDELQTVALQRTIKALGTFAFQVKIRKKTGYARYIDRVINSVIQNPQFSRFFPSDLKHMFTFKIDS